MGLDGSNRAKTTFGRVVATKETGCASDAIWPWMGVRTAERRSVYLGGCSHGPHGLLSPGRTRSAPNARACPRVLPARLAGRRRRERSGGGFLFVGRGEPPFDSRLPSSSAARRAGGRGTGQGPPERRRRRYPLRRVRRGGFVGVGNFWRDRVTNGRGVAAWACLRRKHLGVDRRLGLLQPSDLLLDGRQACLRRVGGALVAFGPLTPLGRTARVAAG